MRIIVIGLLELRYWPAGRNSPSVPVVSPATRGENMNLRPLIAHPQVCSPFRDANHMVGVFDLFPLKSRTSLFWPQMTETRMVRVNKVLTLSAQNQNSGLTHNVGMLSREEGELRQINNSVVLTFTRNTTFDRMLLYK